MHHLAKTYGWTESEILRLPTRKRVAYVELINEDTERENAASKRKK